MPAADLTVPAPAVKLAKRPVPVEQAVPVELPECTGGNGVRVRCKAHEDCDCGEAEYV